MVIPRAQAYILPDGIRVGGGPVMLFRDCHVIRIFRVVVPQVPTPPSTRRGKSSPPSIPAQIEQYEDGKGALVPSPCLPETRQHLLRFPYPKLDLRATECGQGIIVGLMPLVRRKAACGPAGGPPQGRPAPVGLASATAGADGHGGIAVPRKQAGGDENCLLQVLSESTPMQDAMALTGLRRHVGGRDGCAIIPAGGRCPGV